ncbi:MAG TPA: ribose-5-phosphate isomerase RpiA, partial [Ignavibacteriaceae bacterium]|nr:ribose-5-phosphate isomerase RpiA [Ignavibacteriaceae bacterium]
EKLNAGEKAIEFIEDGMLLGLGTGSTVYYTIKKIGELVNEGLKIKAVSTSAITSQLASSLGIEILPFNSVQKTDLTIDGADEVDPNLDGIKGGGGALLYEKIVAGISEKVIWVIDSGKQVKKLGKFPLPVEVIQFGSSHLLDRFQKKNFRPVLRMRDNKPFVTDAGNFIIDLFLEEIDNAVELNCELNLMTGVVETGLFLNIADIVITGKGNDTEITKRKS